ncbi:lisH domain-containing protein ARMC9-like isoform X1 [Colletes gigas]|uniref:lisH domain-containing protein ARMC9-like isoform X1 n=2 Tax=Colletes gigas TaxID=935657 RepID=UPI001C9B173D|nr:lisH domain-containing protein ARMC9-like isoform X1 [Colletes gigas]
MDKNLTVDLTDNKDLRFLHQFLIEHNFESTAGALIAEAATKGFKHLQNNLKTNNETYTEPHEQIMLTYKSGDWRTFFKLWNMLIPEDAKQTKAYKILTLNLHVYFTMLPKRILLSYWYKEKDKTQTDTVNSMTSLSQQDSEYEEDFMIEIEENMNNSMEELRVFLNTTGKELKNDMELRPFFALPFIENPYAEPSLSKIFEKSWIDELTENLCVFLKKYKQQNISDVGCNIVDSNKMSPKHGSVSEESQTDSITRRTTGQRNVPIVPNDRNIPVFLENDEDEEQYTLSDDTKHNQKSKSVQTVLMNFSNLIKSKKKLLQCSQELSVTKFRLCSVHSNYEKLKVRFHKLHADYHKLMTIARVLTTALENSARGHAMDFQAMLETCMKIFPDLFNQNIKDNSYCSSELLLDKSNSEMKIVEHSVPYVVLASPKLLNFKKIKLHLINGSIKTKLFLLQALRRKITVSLAGEREETVHEYISKDLLGLHGQIAGYEGKCILPYLLPLDNTVMPQSLQQSIARLLNALASFRCGRDYLSFDSTVVDVVCNCLKNACDNDLDTFTCDMMIATLQKLSVRKQQRIYMIENGLVEWLIHHLHDQCSVIDAYRLEYASALLMNLSLHQIAQRRASNMASLLISTLTELLVMNYSSALPYVNGALSIFLTNHTINEEAKKLNISSLLEQYSKHKNEEARKYLDQILKIHKGEITIETEIKEMADNDNEEFDVLESELEENDPVKNKYDELCGEPLLASCYTVLPNTFHKEELISDASINSVVHGNEEQIKSSGKHLPRKSSNTTVASSTILEAGSEAELAVTQKLSSIASLNIDSGNKTMSDTEEAFVSKPKLPRTPP